MESKILGFLEVYNVINVLIKYKLVFFVGCSDMDAPRAGWTTISGRGGDYLQGPTGDTSRMDVA